MNRRRVFSLLFAVILALTLSVSALADPASQPVVSRAGITAYGPLTEYAPVGDPAWGASKPAFETSWPGWPSIDGAVWIGTATNTEYMAPDSWRWFHDEVVVACTAYDIEDTSISLTADNAEEFYFNGQLVGTDGILQGSFVDDVNIWLSVIEHPISPQPGTNTLDFIIRNYGSRPTSNPTGLIYRSDFNYQLPGVSWTAPSGAQPLLVEAGANLRIRFQLTGQGGVMLRTFQPVVLKIHGPSTSTEVGPVVAQWDPSSTTSGLKFNTINSMYTTVFQTRKYNLVPEDYTIIVHDECSDEVLGMYKITIVPAQ